MLKYFTQQTNLHTFHIFASKKIVPRSDGVVNKIRTVTMFTRRRPFKTSNELSAGGKVERVIGVGFTLTILKKKITTVAIGLL